MNSDNPPLDAAALSAPTDPGPRCYRCKLYFDPPAPGVVYCAECVVKIRDNRRAKSQAMRGPNFFASPATDPSAVQESFRPVTSTVGGKEVCGCCGSEEVTACYGMCCYGCGSFSHCFKCGAVLDFNEDAE